MYKGILLSMKVSVLAVTSSGQRTLKSLIGCRVPDDQALGLVRAIID
jgi:hypothetical protein